jgi:hypothetical protein
VVVDPKLLLGGGVHLNLPLLLLESGVRRRNLKNFL